MSGLPGFFFGYNKKNWGRIISFRSSWFFLEWTLPINTSKKRRKYVIWTLNRGEDLIENKEIKERQNVVK